MGDRFMVVTEKDWEKATPDRRSWMIFNTLRSLEERVKVLEGRLFLDKVCSFAGGILGGILAVGAYFKFKF